MANIFEFQLHEAIKDRHYLALTPIQDFSAQLVSSSLAKTLFYPLDVAQVLMQTNAEDSRDGLIQTLIHLYQTYGITSWFRGNLASCAIGTTLAVGNFLGSFPLLRNTGSTPIARFLIHASITTAIFPFQVAKIRMITHPNKFKSTFETISSIYHEEELPALYRGLTATLLGIIVNGITTSACLRLISSVWKKPKSEMSFWESFLFGALGAILASAIQYPVDTAVKIVQSQPNDPDNVLRTILNTGRIPRAGGFLGLFKGFSSNLEKPLAIPLQYKLSDWTTKLIFNGKSAIKQAL